jgi:hypothetical protein
LNPGESEKSGMSAAEEKRALICSMLTMILSIPALIGS